jgi:tetratricopeptide (TPR) repeat protein
MHRVRVLLVASVIVAMAATQSWAKDAWISIRSEHFTLIGNARDRDIRRVAIHLEQFREVFSSLFPRASAVSPIPTTVIVFKDDASFTPFKPLYQGRRAEAISGYFQSAPDVNYITVSVSESDELNYRTIFHEYVHLAVKNNFRSIPLWLSEGLAEYFSTVRVSKKDARGIVGEPIEARIQNLREHDLIPLRELFSMDHKSLDYTERERSVPFYAQSWALVHLIIHRDGEPGILLSRLLDKLAAHASSEVALSSVMNESVEELESELRLYLKRDPMPVSIVALSSIGNVDSKQPAIPLSDGAAHGYLGDLLLHISQPDAAEKELKTALSLDPTGAISNAAMGMLRVKQRNFEDALTHLRKALEIDKANYLWHYNLASALTSQWSASSRLQSLYPRPIADEIRAELRQAIELKPNFPDAYYLFGFVDLVMDEQLEEARTMLERAVSLAPGRDEFLIILAQAHYRKRDYAEARRVLEQAIADAEHASVRADAKELLINVNLAETYATSAKERGESEAAAETRFQGASTGEQIVAPKQRLARRNGGQVVRGLLISIDCSSMGTVLNVKSGERVFRFRSESLNNISFATYVPMTGRFVECGPRVPASLVYATYRPIKQPRSKFDGEVTAVDFVPEDLELEPLPPVQKP